MNGFNLINISDIRIFRFFPFLVRSPLFRFPPPKDLFRVQAGHSTMPINSRPMPLPLVLKAPTATQQRGHHQRI